MTTANTDAVTDAVTALTAAITTLAATINAAITGVPITWQPPVQTATLAVRDGGRKLSAAIADSWARSQGSANDTSPASVLTALARLEQTVDVGQPSEVQAAASTALASANSWAVGLT